MDIEELKALSGAYKDTMQGCLTCQVIEEIEKHSVITRAKAISINCKNYGIEDRRYMSTGVPAMVDAVIKNLIHLGYIYKKEPGLYVKCN